MTINIRVSISVELNYLFLLHHIILFNYLTLHLEKLEKVETAVLLGLGAVFKGNKSCLI